MATVALNKIIAVEKGVKSSSAQKVTSLYHKIQKTSLLEGISKTYRPKDEEGDPLPSEESRVSVYASEILKDAQEALSGLFDVVATKDWGNAHARADIVVEGETVLAAVPVTYLLFLEKQLTDIKTLIAKIPLLDQSEIWSWDENQACYATKPVDSHRTQKVPRALVKYAATKEHPAQVSTYNEEIVVGFWTKIRYSGALPITRQKELLGKVEKLQHAVKFARAEANATEVEQIKTGDQILSWLFKS